MGINNKNNKLSGQELKNLMVNGRLPDEYISEENLDALLDYEYEQMGDANEYYDMSIVKYCSALIEKNYTDANYEKRKWETFEKIKEQIWLMDAPPNDEDIAESTTKVKPQKKRKFFPLKISAACIAVLVSLQLLSLMVFGVNLLEWTRDRFLSMIGVEVQQGDTTQIALESRVYETIEEFEATEGIKILVPTWLPGDLEIEIITYFPAGNGDGRIDINYDDGTTVLFIRLYANLPDVEGAGFFKINNITFYVFENYNIIWWEYNGKFYSFDCGFDIKEYVEKIIENIK